MRAEQPACLGQDTRRIGKRTNGVVQAAQECLPALGPAKRLFCAGPLGGRPCSIGDHLDQRNLIRCPAPRRRTVDAKCGNPMRVLYEWRDHECGGLVKEKLVALGDPQAFIGTHVIDNDRLAATAGEDDRFAEIGEPAAKR